MKDLKEIVEPLIRWFRENKRDLPWRQTKDPYAVWVSEIMLVLYTLFADPADCKGFSECG